MPDPTTSPRTLTASSVWLCRVLVGATFAFSGWAKAVDPWGFVYKLSDYIAVVGWDVSRPLLTAFAIALAVGEMTLGVVLMMGGWRRVAVWCAAAVMAVMTPLTLWLWIDNPVQDCGCFGDAWVISNGATFAKNVILCVLVAWLWIFNTRVRGLIRAQYVVYSVALTVAYGLVLSLTGYLVQPFVDFRPYSVGTNLRQAVDRDLDMALFNAADDEVGDSLLSRPDTTALVLIPEPALNGQAYSHFAQSLGKVLPTYVVTPDIPEEKRLTADDTQIKAMARGDVSLMLIADGRVLWKRSLALVPTDALDVPRPRQALFALEPHLSSRFWVFTIIYLVLLLAMPVFSEFRVERKEFRV